MTPGKRLLRLGSLVLFVLQAGAVARGRGRPHDAARTAPPDGARAPLRPRPLGCRRAPGRLDFRLLPPRRFGGVGFDRTATGSDAVSQYSSVAGGIFGDPQRVPEKFLLWFHHLPWDHPMRSGLGPCGRGASGTSVRPVRSAGRPSERPDEAGQSEETDSSGPPSDFRGKGMRRTSRQDPPWS